MEKLYKYYVLNSRNFTTLQKLKKRTVFKLINMGFAKEDTREVQETNLTTFTRTCTSEKLTFTATGKKDMTKLQANGDYILLKH